MLRMDKPTDSQSQCLKLSAQPSLHIPCRTEARIVECELRDRSHDRAQHDPLFVGDGLALHDLHKANRHICTKVGPGGHSDPPTAP
jgi:hypothetical protein